MGSLSPCRGNLATTEPRQCRSKLKKVVVAGQGAAVKEVTSFQQRRSSFGCAAENFLPSAGDGSISGLSLDPVRIEDKR